METIADRYSRFARVEAAGRSVLFETLAKHVAKSPASLTFLSRLPHDRQQPNLFFAALRLVAGTPASVAEFDHALEMHAHAIVQVMLTRTTQTNEPGRCAVLVPALSRLEGPLALIEVGASAGLCLLPDAYGYDWGHHGLSPPAKFGSIAPVFPCKASKNTPLPATHPEIVWRAGLDLNPLDVSQGDDLAWLEMLVWPEHHERLSRLRGAAQIARTERPLVVKGDLRKDLAALIAEAPKDATLVVFHSAVLSYLPDQNDRDAFAAEMVGHKRVVWISNEGHRTFPQFVEAKATAHEDMFLLSVNGKPTAWTAPHGQEALWI